MRLRPGVGGPRAVVGSGHDTVVLDCGVRSTCGVDAAVAVQRLIGQQVRDTEA